MGETQHHIDLPREKRIVGAASLVAWIIVTALAVTISHSMVVTLVVLVAGALVLPVLAKRVLRARGHRVNLKSWRW